MNELFLLNKLQLKKTFGADQEQRDKLREKKSGKANLLNLGGYGRRITLL